MIRRPNEAGTRDDSGTAVLEVLVLGVKVALPLSRTVRDVLMVAVVASAPPVKVIPPDALPRLPLLAICNVPAEIVVPPV